MFPLSGVRIGGTCLESSKVDLHNKECTLKRRRRTAETAQRRVGTAGSVQRRGCAAGNAHSRGWLTYIVFLILWGASVGGALRPRPGYLKDAWSMQREREGEAANPGPGRWTRHDRAAVARGSQPGAGAIPFLDTDSSGEEFGGEERAEPTSELPLYVAGEAAPNRSGPLGFDDPEGLLEDPDAQCHWQDLDGQGDWQNEPPDEAAASAAGEAGQGRPVADFVKAANFTGQLPGMVFKRGALGQGYYADNIGTVIQLAPELRPLLQVKPVCLQLDVLIPSQVTSADGSGAWRAEPPQPCASPRIESRQVFSPKTDEPTTAPRGGGRRAKRRPRRPPSNAENSFTWPNDGSLAAADPNHRTSGLWAIDSVNPNAWAAGMESYVDLLQTFW